ncbi:FAD-dependent oxidoreductase [Streptomyces turgidiscabies]|uniref:FAD binding domain protein n=1 Tax=Streptomyces turgidiscabies (strain Car8) TaxID=698760 RepID=L7FDA3_STRT8|nr:MULTISPECIES: FAD-dependent oxidoreductase [Streptomyces]ELP69051.1 FAD binding domain protein [Streptomyces turgidiscabies Car8]MDX3498241.1 FAD-dependent oxidoreductase [Streptomyces turgidiscabies]GAQ75214.1 pentachlorophenol 4-monooxygenase [Streptomyces turgidiscabies]
MNHSMPLDVLIIGAGPTGTTLAIDLARRGLAIRVVNKSDAVFDGSRAKGVQPRSLEVLDDLGALDSVLASGSTYPLLGIHLGPLAAPWRMMRNRQPSADVPYPNTWLIPQYSTDRALHDRLEQLGHRVEFATSLVALTQDTDLVTAKVAGPDGIEEITARYVVGADGGGSTVRTQLGIGFTGSTDEEDRMLIVDAVTTGLSRDRWHMWPQLKGRFTGACPLPHSDLFQWMIRLAPDEEPMLDEARLNERIRSGTGNRHITLSDIRWTSVFRPNIRLAESYGQGRVFLAGDAAHVHTPAGAQGLNTGIQDSYNLGWKLAQVLAGADPALLDTYEAERMPIAAAVLGLSTKKYDGMSKLDPASLKRGKDEQQLALTYFGGPLAPADSGRTQTLRVGDRMPDAVLTGADGKHVRLFDVLRGPHFTALAHGRDAVQALGGLEQPPSGARLKRIAVGSATEGADHVLSDTAGTLGSVHGFTEDTLLLVRPDGYIGHIATEDFLNSARTAIRTMTPSADSRAGSATHPGAGDAA